MFFWLSKIPTLLNFAKWSSLFTKFINPIYLVIAVTVILGTTIFYQKFQISNLKSDIVKHEKRYADLNTTLILTQSDLELAELRLFNSQLDLNKTIYELQEANKRYDKFINTNKDIEDKSNMAIKELQDKIAELEKENNKLDRYNKLIKDDEVKRMIETDVNKVIDLVRAAKYLLEP